LICGGPCLHLCVSFVCGGRAPSWVLAMGGYAFGMVCVGDVMGGCVDGMGCMVWVEAGMAVVRLVLFGVMVILLVCVCLSGMLGVGD